MTNDTRRTLTEAEIVQGCNELAASFARMAGFSFEEGMKFYNSDNPRAQGFWSQAVAAYAHIAKTDVTNALAEVQEDPSRRQIFLVTVDDEFTDPLVIQQAIEDVLGPNSSALIEVRDLAEKPIQVCVFSDCSPVIHRTTAEVPVTITSLDEDTEGATDVNIITLSDDEYAVQVHTAAVTPDAATTAAEAFSLIHK